MRVGVWLSGAAAAFGLIVGAVGATDGIVWLLAPGVASLVTALAWSEGRAVWWGVAATVAHWTPLLLLALTAWHWAFLGLPLVPGALAQSVALYSYARSRAVPARPAHA